MPFHIGLLVFPDITQLDMTGPYEVFIKFPDARVHLIWKTRDPVKAGGGMQIMPTMTFAECPQLDLICVPGGAGMNPLLNDAETLDFIRRQAKGARYVTSVCTGALVLGAAGLLQGQARRDALDEPRDAGAFGATPVAERVVIDGNVITGGGVRRGSISPSRSRRKRSARSSRSRSSWASSTIRIRHSMRARPSAPTPRWSRRPAPPPPNGRPSGRPPWMRPPPGCADRARWNNAIRTTRRRSPAAGPRRCRTAESGRAG